MPATTYLDHLDHVLCILNTEILGEVDTVLANCIQPASSGAEYGIRLERTQDCVKTCVSQTT